MAGIKGWEEGKKRIKGTIGKRKYDGEGKKSVDNRRLDRYTRSAGKKRDRKNGEKHGTDTAALDVWCTR